MQNLSSLHHAKVGLVFAFAAFIVAWAVGLSAGVPPEAILKRSVAGAIAFYILGAVLCRLVKTFLDAPGQPVRKTVSRSCRL